MSKHAETGTRLARLVAVAAALFVRISAAYPQQVVNGSKAAAFFAQFKKTSPAALSITYDNIPRAVNVNPSVGYGWVVSPAESLVPIWIDGTATVKVDQDGKRYLEQYGSPAVFANRVGFIYWILGGRDAQISDAFPAALMANRASYLIRAPDKVLAADGSVIDLNTNPVGYLRAASWHKGNYDQDDGGGWTDYNPESRNAHYYWWPTNYWPQEGPYNVKIEPLGNNFLRVTFNNQITGTRSGWKFSPGVFGPSDPDLSAFDKDQGPTLRAETRHYWMAGNSALQFHKTDPAGTTPSPFDDGVPVWHNYGVSFWHEEDGVEIAAITPEAPSGTSFVQLLTATSDPQYLDYPVEIRNTGAAAAVYRLSANGFQSNIPAFDLSTVGYLALYLDSNGNRILDGAEAGTRLAKLTPSISGGGALKCIVRIDTTRLAPNEMKLTEFNLTVNLVDPADVMTLKGASLRFQSYRAESIAGLTKANVFYTRGVADLSAPANRAPQAIIRATAAGAPLANGATLTAGTEIKLESIGTDPDAHLNEQKTMGHRFYLPEGYSRQGATLTYKLWRAGANKFLLHVGDGYARAFEDFTVNVVEAANAQPAAYVEYPQAGASHPANVAVLFSAAVGDAFSRDPDGGPPGSHHGIVRFDWDFGDGTAAQNVQHPSHVYTAAGSYNVRLTVTDDEGSTGSVVRPLTIIAPNRAPVARIRTVDAAAFMEFGLAEVTAADSTDADGAADIARYRWSFAGPNGYSDISNQVFVNNPPRYLFSTWHAGRYTVYLTVEDKWGAAGSASLSFEVKPWDGIIRANAIAADGGPGQAYFGFDIDPEIKKGWSPIFGGISISPPDAPIARLGGKTIYLQSNGTLNRANNPTLPAGTPADLAGVFSSAVHTIWGPKLFFIKDLPAGRYDLTAYLYDSSRAAPGTQYAALFGETRLEIAVPSNPTYQDFIARGVINHAGGDLTISGVAANAADPSTPLAGFVLVPLGVDRTPPGAPGDLRLK